MSPRGDEKSLQKAYIAEMEIGKSDISASLPLTTHALRYVQVWLNKK
jgi:hypothetical protein